MKSYATNYIPSTNDNLSLQESFIDSFSNCFTNNSGFEYDKMKIIFSESFKRLANKTQVFSNHKGSNGHKYRTRLTHSLEVAQLASRVAEKLGLNTIVAEILGLTHDIAHPPFGHQGQDALNDVLMKETSGKESFEHNSQAIRLLTIIEPLNLSPVILNGLRKRKEHGLDTPNNFGESQVMNIVDAITYVAGDLQDSIEMEAFDCNKLFDTKIINHLFNLDKDILIKNFGNAEKVFFSGSYLHKRILNYLSQDLIQNTFKQMSKHKISSIYDFMYCEEKIIANSPIVYEQIKDVKQFLYKNVYATEEMLKEREKQKNILKSLFYFYKENTHLLGSQFIKRYENEECSLERTIVDYIAGCDDKYVYDLFQEYNLK